MWEVFQLHLEKHFPKVKERFTDDQWRKLFIEYRGCSPAEIGGAVKRTHDTLYYRGFPREVEPEILWKALLEERNNFKPALANPSISNQLAKILLEADFARPVRGSDRLSLCDSGKEAVRAATGIARSGYCCTRNIGEVLRYGTAIAFSNYFASQV